MPRQRLSMPVSFMLLIAGTALSYYVLHTQGWSWNGIVPMAEVWKHLPATSRLMAVAGLVASAWGLGGVLNALLTKPSSDDT